MINLKPFGFSEFALSMVEPSPIIESTIILSVSITEFFITMEFSIDAFFILQFSPMLEYGPIKAPSVISVLSPIIAGPLIFESSEILTFFPSTTLP
jgi:hypothetical protein